MSNKVLFKSKSDITNFFNSEANQSREIKDGDLTNIKQLKLNNLEETLLNFCLKANQKIFELGKSMENLKKHNGLGEGEEGVGGGANASGNGGGERSSNPQQERGRAREREERGREEWDVSNNFKHKFNRLNNRLDYLESQVDENATRLRKGTLICSSSSKEGHSLLQPIMARSNGANVSTNNKCTEDELVQVLELIQKKYRVQLVPSNISASHWLPNGSFIIRFNDRGINSPWQKLVEAMAEGGDRNINLFLNFNLTRKRLSLLAEVRRFKKEKKIEKYEVNENGQISIRVRSKWMKVTQHYSKKTDIQPSEMIYTYSNYKLQTTVEDLYSRS